VVSGQTIGPQVDRWLRLKPNHGAIVTPNFTAKPATAPPRYHRSGERRALRVPGRLTWRDAGGALRFVSVMTRDVSDVDVFVECQVPASIPRFRLVHLQIEKAVRMNADLPRALQQGKVLTAIYRVGPCKQSTGTPEGYALRLLVEPVASHLVTRTPIAAAN
jgi:hypothetical protein